LDNHAHDRRPRRRRRTSSIAGLFPRDELNPITVDLHDQLGDPLNDADRHPGVGVVLLRAEGRAFSTALALPSSGVQVEPE
jgi:enoyl-CoA hydratase/carnithine racemase